MGDRSALSSYLDADQVADAAVPYVSGMIAAGIVNGVRSDWLAPGKALTRAELITMLDRAIIQVISEPGRYELSDGAGHHSDCIGGCDPDRRNGCRYSCDKRCRRRNGNVSGRDRDPVALPFAQTTLLSSTIIPSSNDRILRLGQ